MAHRLAVQRVQHRVSRPVGGRSAPVCLPSFPEVQRLAPKGTLVDFPFVGAGEGQAVVLELDDGGWGLAAHVLDGVLVLFREREGGRKKKEREGGEGERGRKR